MRNAALWGGLLIVVAVLLVGFLILRSPQTATVPTATTSVEEEASNGQLTVEVPTPLTTATTPPAALSSPSPSPATTTKVVTISDTSFTPSTLTVPVNTTVTFTNNGQGTHWPASVPHPTHTGLPGFDAKKGLATGESYSFTFKTAGTWGFHDHLNPGMKGSIIVQ